MCGDYWVTLHDPVLGIARPQQPFDMDHARKTCPDWVATEALMAGTTAIVDHHESPSAIEGSLSVIADACAEVGIRVDAAYGVTDRWDRDGRLRDAGWPPPAMSDGARRGLAENERFLRAGGRGRDSPGARRHPLAPSRTPLGA